MQRCPWAENDPLLRDYHDTEWGVPERDSRALWEALILDSFQAGLSWITILRKRAAFRQAFKGFNPDVVAKFSKADVTRLLGNAGIVRSRPKIEAAIANARAYLAMRAAGDDFSTFIWTAAGGAPIQASGRARSKSALSEQISTALRARGFKFVGAVTVYAWMQAMGIVNDHVPGCDRRTALAKVRKTTPRRSR